MLEPITRHEEDDSAHRLLTFDLDSYRDKGRLTHGLHPYPAKFVPQIPSETIALLSKPGDLVLDPFCGSGTTLVEASIQHRRSIGFDSNPLACLIARVKTTPLHKEQLVAARRTIEAISGKLTPLRPAFLVSEIDAPKPFIPNQAHWFKPRIVEELAVALGEIERVDDGQVRAFLRAALSSIVVRVSNQESDTRYAAVTKPTLNRGAVPRLLSAKVAEMEPRYLQLERSCPDRLAEVIQCDSTAEFPLRSGTVNLVVTSPPYPNTYDYYLYHRLRMAWLGMDYARAQADELGSRNKHNDHRLGISSFTEKFQRSLEEMSRVLKPGGHCCIVIGDAVIRGEQFDLASIVTKQATKCRLTPVSRFDYPLRKYTRTFTPGMKLAPKLGHILVFKKGA